MADNFSAQRGVPYTLQSAAQTGNGLALAIPDSFKNHTFYIKGLGGVASGAVLPESADTPLYTGIWAPLTTAITVVDVAEVVFPYVGTLKAVRCRISTTVVTGNVTVVYVGS